MTQNISGPGIGLPLSQNLYPSQLLPGTMPYDASTNKVALAPGDTLPIPAGEWYIDLGMYLVIQYLDPITNTWSMGPTAGWIGGTQFVKSDGFTARVANLLGCPVAAVVAALGSGYVQSTTTVTATPGNSTWVPIVGGALALSGGTLTGVGAGYGVAPEVIIPAPPPASNNPNGVGGIPASGYCTIASGTVSGFVFTSSGGGYPSAPGPIVVLPSPTDPNINVGITAATITFTLTGAGTLRGALCTNPGAPLSNPNQFTLTVAGAGSSGSLTGVALQTVTAASISGAGSGYASSLVMGLTTTGGVPPQGSIAGSPYSLFLAWRPRQAQIGLAVTGVGSLATQVGAIYDGGLFLTNTAPSPVITSNPTAGIATVVAATLALTMGGVADIATLQPAP